MEATQHAHEDTEQLHHEVERKEEEEEMNRHERKEEDTHAPEPCGDEEEKLPVVLYKTVPQKEVAQLQCPIHKGPLHDPVGTDKCKHVFCRSCLAAWVDLQGHCPLDSRPVPVEQLVPAQAVADKLNALLIHCRWGVVQDPETGAWVAASGDGYCPALITIGDRKAHEDSCAYRPVPQTAGGAQLMNKIQFPNVNVEQVVQALKSNLSRFERVLAERMDVLLAQMRSLLEEQNLHRIRSGASGAMNNFKEEMEAAIAGLMAKQAPLFRSIADKSESLCSEARDAARAKGSALYEGAVHIRNQAAVASGEALSKLDGLAQEIMSEVKLALMRSLEPTPCPNPPPPPPPDRLFEENGEEEEVEENGEEQEQEQEQQVDADVEVHVSCPATVTVEDADWDDSPAWIPAQPTLLVPPRYPPPPPPRSSKLRLSL